MSKSKNNKKTFKASDLKAGELSVYKLLHSRLQNAAAANKYAAGTDFGYLAEAIMAMPCASCQNYAYCGIPIDNVAIEHGARADFEKKKGKFHKLLRERECKATIIKEWKPVQNSNGMTDKQFNKVEFRDGKPWALLPARKDGKLMKIGGEMARFDRFSCAKCYDHEFKDALLLRELDTKVEVRKQQVEGTLKRAIARMKPILGWAKHKRYKAALQRNKDKPNRLVPRRVRTNVQEAYDNREDPAEYAHTTVHFEDIIDEVMEQ